MNKRKRKLKARPLTFITIDEAIIPSDWNFVVSATKAIKAIRWFHIGNITWEKKAGTQC
jgi:hypothetical protein